MAFKRAEIREILGEAYTDDVATKLVNLHRGVVDPLVDELETAKRDVTKYKTEAEKLPGLQKDLDELKKDDWKTKYENEKKAHDDYKAQVTRDAQTAKVKAAYKKLLSEEKISEKTLDAVMNATDFSKMKLKDDGSLDGLEDLKKEIGEKWGSFKVIERQRGPKVDNPSGGSGGGTDSSIRDQIKAWHDQRFGAAPVATSVSTPQNQ